jgi:hypothetical protein
MAEVAAIQRTSNPYPYLRNAYETPIERTYRLPSAGLASHSQPPWGLFPLPAPTQNGIGRRVVAGHGRTRRATSLFNAAAAYLVKPTLLGAPCLSSVAPTKARSIGVYIGAITLDSPESLTWEV